MPQRSVVARLRHPVLEPLAFVAWWYGTALQHVVLYAFYMLVHWEDRFSLLVMLKQIVLLQPLHHDYALVGRAIGVVLRLLWVVVGLLVFVLVLALALLEILLWIAIPPLALYGIWWGWLG